MVMDGDIFKEKEEQQLNRQINYYVIRYMWQVLHGRDANDTIYFEFDTSRERFTRVIDSGRIRYHKGELEALFNKTSIDKMYFTGERRFVIRNMSEDGWKELFRLRKSKTSKGDYKETEKAVKRKIKASRNPKIEENKDLYALCYFCKNGKGIPLSGGEQYNSLMAILKEYDIERLKQYNNRALKSLADALREKEALINAILICRQAEQASNSSKRMK